MRNRSKYEILSKKWIVFVLLVTFLILLIVGGFIYTIDPFFHYRSPREGMSYLLHANKQRFINDGISVNWEYDSIITGTSMTENFKVTEFEDLKLGGNKTVKLPFEGGSLKEIDQNLRRAYLSENEIKVVLRGIDMGSLLTDKDYMKTFDYPVYLTNDEWYDDVYYLLNKDVVSKGYDVVKYTLDGKVTTDFDKYSFWGDDLQYRYGKEQVLKTYSIEDRAPQSELSAEEKQSVKENIRQNVTDLIAEHPETTFYIFLTPYSICYWDKMDADGSLAKYVEAQQIAFDEILKYNNVKLFSFNNNFELTCNLDNYTDYAHYGMWVNSQILQWMKDDEYRITKDNLEAYIDNISKFYSTYDYESLHK